MDSETAKFISKLLSGGGENGYFGWNSSWGVTVPGLWNVTSLVLNTPQPPRQAEGWLALASPGGAALPLVRTTSREPPDSTWSPL